jgi:hypothetical protein
LFVDAPAVPAPVVTEFTASVTGKTSRIVIGEVGGHPYVDEADLLVEGESGAAPIRRDELRVPALQAS